MRPVVVKFLRQAACQNFAKSGYKRYVLQPSEETLDNFNKYMDNIKFNFSTYLAKKLDMLRIIIVVLLQTSILAVTFGQDLEDLPTNGKFAERIKSMRIAFITNKLELSAEQSKQFWPIYNEFEVKQRGVRQSFLENKSIHLMSDQEVEKFIDDRFAKERELLSLKEEYYNKLKGTISIRQLANLNKAERAFKKELLSEMQARRRQRMSGNKGKND